MGLCSSVSWSSSNKPNQSFRVQGESILYPVKDNDRMGFRSPKIACPRNGMHGTSVKTRHPRGPACLFETAELQWRSCTFEPPVSLPRSPLSHPSQIFDAGSVWEGKLHTTQCALLLRRPLHLSPATRGGCLSKLVSVGRRYASFSCPVINTNDEQQRGWHNQRSHNLTAGSVPTVALAAFQESKG